MSVPPDYYSALGLERDATVRDIKRAYRAAARELHPDLPANKGNSAAASRFKVIRDAYEVLSDPVRRREYDHWGKDPFGPSDLPWRERSGATGPEHSESAEDIRLRTATGEGVASIFEDLFRPAGGAGTASPPRTPWSPAELDREAREGIRREAEETSRAQGAARQQEAQQPRSEHRFGFDPEALAEAALRGDMEAADRATGMGAGPGAPEASGASQAGEALRISVQVPFLLAVNGGVHRTQYRLPDTSGRWSLEDLELSVPAGLEDGGCIRLRGQGHHGQGAGMRGDLLVDVAVQEHPVFRRAGAEIVLDLPLTPAEAATGVRLDVPTLSGKARLRVPPGVRSGQRLRMRGLGLLDAETGVRGNQVLVVQIQIPARLGTEELALLQELDRRTDWDPRSTWWDDPDVLD